ncbi:deoxyribose-phosphate aldolase [Ereboglobus sp. PH5-5]|uniref:deoxyribose-phosphate aldolase n=1 Tax=Ereboglobus sp. PH5-5 TaxID=2940529 RepID=UPI0024064A79|nr:deoxyribose-phosphate aldolase [Ereboglobus sp. PH5-5]MDF9834091.1 deoxyribose-phosphate aldolase [Ereboglobus sp. PH5-5]
MSLTPAEFAATLDSTNLRLDATEADIEALCREAVEGGFACVMIYPTSVPLAARVLAGSKMRIGTVVGFPSGRFTTAAKEAEINAMARAGAHEVDIVMDYAALRAGRGADVLAELVELTRVAHANGQLIKVITENCFLTETQMLDALKMCEDAGADFIKTSTGFGSAGAKREQIELWAKNRRDLNNWRIKLKAAGGIKTLTDALALIEAGASRLGTSNAGALLAEFKGGPAAKAPGAY